MPAPGQTQTATVDKFIAGWKKWTPEDYLASWSDDCTQHMLPFNLNRPVRSRAQVEAVLPQLMEALTNYEKLDVYRVIHDPEKSQAVIYATSKADTPWDDFKWNNDYAVFLTLSEDGEKIQKFEEMVDTAFFQQFFPKFQKYVAENGGHQ